MQFRCQEQNSGRWCGIRKTNPAIEKSTELEILYNQSTLCSDMLFSLSLCSWLAGCLMLFVFK